MTIVGMRAHADLALFLQDLSFTTLDSKGLSSGMLMSWKPSLKVVMTNMHQISILVDLEIKELDAFLRVITV